MGMSDNVHVPIEKSPGRPRRIGIMGGTFNPIHLGHIHMAKAAAASGQLDQVLVMPTGHPPHKQSPAPAVDR